MWHTSWTHEFACDSFSSHQLRQFVCRESILFFISRLPADFWSLAHPYCSLSFRICARASSTCARHQAIRQCAFTTCHTRRRMHV